MKKRPKNQRSKSKGDNGSPRKAKATEKQAAVRRVPTEEEIRNRAYQMFLERGGQPGHAIDDWVAAERELSARN